MVKNLSRRKNYVSIKLIRVVEEIKIIIIIINGDKKSGSGSGSGSGVLHYAVLHDL